MTFIGIEQNNYFQVQYFYYCDFAVMYMYKNVRNDFLIVAQWIMMDHFYGIVILFRWKARGDDMIYYQSNVWNNYFMFSKEVSYAVKTALL